MLELVPAWIIFLFMTAFSGYYAYLAWYRPEEFERTIRGWANMNSWLPDGWKQSKAYLILNQITIFLFLIIGAVMFSLLSVAILVRLFR